ncbi:MAG: hypothetical protein AAFZ15_02405 [Bacteroidota bacterium]
MSAKPSQLIEDLSNVPNIISSLGLGIAAAQKAFNLDYLNGLERLFAIAQKIHGENNEERDKFKDMFINIVQTMAPYRYQFAETTLAVRLDLAQAIQKGSSASLGVSVGAVTLNAAMTEGFSSNYRAAAEVKTVLQAVPFDPAQVASLIANATALSNKKLDLPDQSAVDQACMEKSAEILGKITAPAT